MKLRSCPLEALSGITQAPANKGHHQEYDG